jgi:hypothetical protein
MMYGVGAGATVT